MACLPEVAAGILWTMMWNPPPICPPRVVTDEMLPRMTRLFDAFCPERKDDVLRLRLEMQIAPASCRLYTSWRRPSRPAARRSIRSSMCARCRGISRMAP